MPPKRVIPSAAELPPPLARVHRSFVAYLRVECGMSPRTIEAYGGDLARLLAEASASGMTDVAELTPRILADHVTTLSRQGQSGASVGRHIATMRVFCRWLVARGMLADNPAKLLDRPAKWNKLPGVLSPSQMRKIVEAPAQAADDDQDPPLWMRDRAMLEVMYASGLRASEVGALSVDDYNPTLGALRVTGKGDKQRLVPTGEPAQEAMERYLRDCRPTLASVGLAKGERRDDGKMFLTRSGRPIERVRVWQLVRKWANVAGHSNVHPHMLRHSFATHLLAGGADLRVVQELLGHADITTTQIYTHIDQTQLRATIAKHHPRP
ncbi:MAG: tyrosine recombinase [Phycisphaerae bacterium]|nr:tyrosine recombinase [Phycisphaerae bacterium]